MVDLDLLNKEQRQAVATTEGPLLILAGAGSGKTRVLTYRIAYLIEKGVFPGNILAITFTNKAAKEMKERVVKIVGEEGEKMWISTFHSSCVRMLRSDIDRLGYHRNFVIYDTSEQEKLIKECLKELNLDEKVYPVKDMLGKIGEQKDRLIDEDTFYKRNYNDFKARNLAEIYVRYQKKLKNNNALDFDDIIMKMVKILKDFPEVLAYYQRKFRYLLVDEYQDTNRAQYEFIRLLSSSHQNLCVVGDDDQSIYGWRGADIKNILDFEKDYPTATIIKLEQNYRSTKTILEAANCVIVNNEYRKNKRLWTDNPEGDSIKLFRADSDRMEVQFVVSEIKRIYQDRRDYNAFAVLYRTNAMSRVLEEGFVTAGIPYRVVGGLKFYDRKEVKDILGYLKLINNPDDAVSLERILNVPKRGIGDSSVDKAKSFALEKDQGLYDVLRNTQQIEGLTKRAAAAIDKFTLLMTELSQMASAKSVSELINEIMDKTGYITELKEENTPESLTRIENLEELYSAAVEFETKEEDKSLSAFLERVALVSDQDSVTENGGITLMTMHTAKGLEYPVVFISGMEEGIFPHFSSMNSNTEMEEERRICYVGITRAKEELYLTCSRQRMLFGRTMFNSVSSFVSEIPEVLITDLSKKQAGMSMNRIYDYDDAPRRVETSQRIGVPISAPIKMMNKIKAQGGEVKAGVRIKHKMFGIGLVIAVKETTGGKQITVQFDSVGLKNLILEASPVEVV